MNKQEIMEIVNNNNGYLYSKIIKDNNIPTIYITRLVNDGKLTKVTNGVYISDVGIEDEYFIRRLKYSKIIYSGESALFLNNLSNKQYVDNEVTIPYGSSVPTFNSCKVIVTRKKSFTLGVEEIETPFGNKVYAYNKERCICDLFIRSGNYDYEDRRFAINEYIKNYCNIKKLYGYAMELGIYDKVKDVFDVLLWN